MASLDHRLNPLFSIKECSSCGALYTADFCCSKGDIEDKILVPKPPQNCTTCGDPVDGLYCRPCAFVRKCLNEGWYIIHDKNEILNTFESSNHNTNIVSAPQEPFIFNQDPGKNSSQSPSQINHNCCYECGDSLDDIFCQRCTCKSCGKGAHYGYNCPPQIPIISNPEPCYNQNLNEILQNLQSLQQQCLLGTCQQCGCNEYDGVCFYCTVGNGTPINFSTPYSSNDSPSFANHPPQPQYVPYSCELCGNDSHYGYDCPPQVPFVYNQDPCFNQNFDYFPQTSPSFPQQYPCCEDCGGPHETFQCQPMNYYEPNPCYDSNYSGFDQTQPPQYTVNHPIFNAQNELLNSQNKIMEQMTSICDMVGQIMQKKEEERRITEDQAAKDRYRKILICYDDDGDYTIAITPVLLTEEPVDSLIMEDEHLDTIPKTESDELIKSSVKDLVHTPSESNGISEGECDLPVYDDFSPKKDEVLDDIISIPLGNGNDHFNVESSLIESVLNHDNVISSPKIDFLIEEFAGELALIAPIPPGIVEADLDPKEDICFIENLMYDNSFPRPPETLKDDSETVIDSNNDYFSSDDDSYENIDYVDASPPDFEIVSLEVVEIVIPEVGGIDTDILLTIKDDILREKLLNVNLLIANIEALKDNSIPSSDFVTKSPSTSLKLFLKETNTFDNSLPLFETFCFNLEEISSGSTTTRSDLSLPDYEAFYLNDDHIEEKSSGSTTTHADFSQYDSFIFDLSINPFPPADRSDFYHEEFADELAHIISPPEYDCFYFKNEPKLGDFTMDVVDDIFDNPTREPRVHVPNILPTHPTLNLDLDFILSSDSLFAYIVCIFLPFPTYPVSPPYLISTGNEDTIFDLGIPIYHSFMPGISHQSGTFMKFNVYPNHLNESSMEILSSICFPMDNLIWSRDCLDFEDSRVHGFVHSYIRASYPQLHLGNPIS
ncbi:hypothetical protein Tco_0303428 [Tanacetum coccineum]